MDGENHGKPYEQIDDLGGFPIFLVQHPYGQPLKGQISGLTLLPLRSPDHVEHKPPSFGRRPAVVDSEVSEVFLPQT